MASVRCRKDTGQLFIDFRYQGQRCREQTLLLDTATNRDRLEKLLQRIERAIGDGSFRYGNFFPDSPRRKQFDPVPAGQTVEAATPALTPPVAAARIAVSTPPFQEFVETWFTESRPRWRRTNIAAVRSVLDSRILPFFKDKLVADLDRPLVLAFRASLSERKGHGGRLLSPKSVNEVMGVLRMITNEAADRYGLTAPFRGLKPLKERRPDVAPFGYSAHEKPAFRPMGSHDSGACVTDRPIRATQDRLNRATCRPRIAGLERV